MLSSEKLYAKNSLNEINELPQFIGKIRNYFELKNITEEDRKEQIYIN